MSHKINLLLLSIIVWAFSISVSSQTKNDAVDFTISLAEGKKVYRIGEPVRVALSFVVKKEGYTIKTKSPFVIPESLSPTENIAITPNDGIYIWKDKYYAETHPVADIPRFQGKSANPIRETIALNDFVRFDKAGKYSFSVTSDRLYYSDPQTKEINSNPTPQKPITSNTIDLEVKEMSQKEEELEIKRLSKLMSPQLDWRKENKYAEELSFLTGDASTIEKVNRFLNPPNFNPLRQNYFQTGLLMARNRALAIKLLEYGFRDLNQEIHFDLLNLLIDLRLADGFVPKEINGQMDWEQRSKIFREIEQPYINQLFTSLPKRTGKSKTYAAFLIFTRLFPNYGDSFTFKTTKNIILESFDQLRPFEQNNLLTEFWEKLKSPSLIPYIEKILIYNGTPEGKLLRPIALKRLIELAPQKARDYIVKDIRKNVSDYDLEVLRLLDDKYLPEIDEILLEHIQAASEGRAINLSFKNQLAARFASPKIYQDLLRIYQNNQYRWNDEQRGGLLAYFLRHNEKEAIPMIEERIVKFGQPNDWSIFFHLTKVIFSNGAEKLLKQRLESDNTKIVESAVYYLSKYGSKSIKKNLENRYQRWLKKWETRRTEFDNKKANDEMKRQKSFQLSFVYALKNAKSWQLTTKEIEELKQTCFSQECLRYFPKN
jgi:hypothetical protein